MSKTQSEALRLALEFEICEDFDINPSIIDAAAAAAELRRLYAENIAHKADVMSFHYAMKDAGWHPGRTDDLLTDIIRAKGKELIQVHAENKALRGLAATCYAGLGAECNLPENWLDALKAAADGEPFETEGLLPFNAAEARDETIRQLEAQIKALREVLQAVEMDVVYVGSGENVISDATRAKVETVLEQFGAPQAAAKNGGAA